MAEQDGEDASKAATKVEEAAANVRQARSPRRRITKSSAESVALRYFQAIGARDLDAAVGLWADGGRDNVRGQIDVLAPEGVRAFLGELLDAVPDLDFDVLSTTTQDERCAVQWRLSGTFAGPGSLSGIAPTGDRVVIEGVDLVTVRDGLIQGNDAYPDSIALPRQLGMIPPPGSRADQRLTGAFNAKTRLISRLTAGDAELVAEGVWVLQGQPARCNVYLIEDDGGVTLFDAGARTMARALARAGAKLGGIRRIVLGHGHTDHRGAAPALGAPVYCHAAEAQDAEGSGGFRYWPEGLAGLPFPHRQAQRLLHRYAWDGGPVEIAGTVTEGDRIAGFTVVEIPGHAPGQIALWRESDRLALSSDCFYTLDTWGRDSEPHLPFEVYNYDTEQARASIVKLAELDPAAAWPGHAKPLTGDVRAQLLRAAEA
ncbi:MAG TPA: MBL fold metallo-hydrolase [Solirubrobacteraceae bacterium]|jgi:glyoxylase-like metal-dependent hydrolase (beta-lactamase superfamily II)/predicted ester cyclase|nr:MBL fold metallo-hydrolase [Solirubrobacteraceae bacterium]